jgi:hypothetical protein
MSINYQAIKFEIERTSCSIHQQNPEVITKNTQDNISLKTCCPDFQDECILLIKQLLAEQVKQEILEPFKGLTRKK